MIESNRAFMGWLDSDQYASGPSITNEGGTVPTIYVRGVDGKLVRQIPNVDNIVAFSPAPPGAAAPYVGATISNWAGVTSLQVDSAEKPLPSCLDQ